MVTKPFDEIVRRIVSLQLPEDIDYVLGIRRGGLVPAYMVANKINKPFGDLEISFRDQNHQRKYAQPRLVQKPSLNCRGKVVLVVDDRANTGRTLEVARAILIDAAKVYTLAVNGDKADYFLFNEPCFKLPWNIQDWADFTP